MSSNDNVAHQARSNVLRAKVEAFTVRASSEGGLPAQPENTIVVFPEGDLATGFSLARPLVDAGHAVRVVGPGATLPSTWPDWVVNNEKVWLTEVGALKVESTTIASRRLELAISAWLDELFGSSLGSVPGSRALLAGACARVFQPIVSAYPIARCLVDAFPKTTIRCAEHEGLYGDIVRAITYAGGGQALPSTPPDRAARLLWRLKSAAAVLATFVGATALYLRDLVAARAPLAAVASRRSGFTPERWVALVGDWERINRHLIDAFALPALDAGERLGVLLVGSLRPGRRVETDFARAEGRDRLTGLASLAARLDMCSVDQAVAPETVWGITRAWIRSVRVALNAGRRLGRSSHLALPGFEMDLRPYVWALAKVVALDSMRVVFASEATRSLLARHQLSGKTVFFCSTAGPQLATISLELQGAGAITVDHPHGAGGDSWTGASWTEATHRCVWTMADARMVEPAGQRLAITGMPCRRTFSPRGRRPLNVLLTTNYVHRDARIGDRWPLRPFQQELLSIVAELRRLGHSELSFRWRPHPADMEAPVNEDHAALIDVDLSRRRSLDDDAEWADLVVTSYSTVLVELLLAEVPVFLQPTPDLWGLPTTDFLDPSRLFFRAHEGARKVSSALRLWCKSDNEWLAPEKMARTGLFGPSAKPASMLEYFGSERMMIDKSTTRV